MIHSKENMRRKKIVDKLIVALGRMSNKDLQEIADLLSMPSAAESVSRLIREQLHLRSLESQRTSITRFNKSTKSRSIASQTSADQESSDYVYRLNSTHNYIDVIVAALSDRNIFPSTLDVIDAINDSFDAKLKYGEFKKEGRKKVIRSLKNHLESMTQNQRKRLLNQFMKSVATRGQDNDEYGALFKILTKNE